MNRKQLDGAVAVVSGAGSGIGRASALSLARRGAHVHVTDVNAARADVVAAELREAGGTAVSHALDVTDADAVSALAQAVLASEGHVDVLHNNAGIAHGGPIEEVDVALWRRIIDVNLLGVIHGVHSFLPGMLARGEGHILNTASMLGLVGAAGLVPYATTKHALVGLSESLNAEVSPRGVHVTAICPGMINTRLYRDATLHGPMADSRDHALRLHDRFGAKPEAVGEAVVRAVLRPSVIRTVPRHQVLPVWALRRLSPRAAQPIARSFSRIMTMR